jgi:hypothetical protein
MPRNAFASLTAASEADVMYFLRTGLLIIHGQGNYCASVILKITIRGTKMDGAVVCSNLPLHSATSYAFLVNVAPSSHPNKPRPSSSLTHTAHLGKSGKRLLEEQVCFDCPVTINHVINCVARSPRRAGLACFRSPALSLSVQP